MSENMYLNPLKLFHLAKFANQSFCVGVLADPKKSERIPGREDVITICIHEALGAVLAGSKM
jgi:hypothetical protein